MGSGVSTHRSPGRVIVLSFAAVTAVLSGLLCWCFLDGADVQPSTPHRARIQAHRARIQAKVQSARESRAKVYAPASRIVAGRVTSDEGSPIPGASVCAWLPAESCCSALPCVTSNSSGQFEINLAPDSSVAALVASAPEFLSSEHDLPSHSRHAGSIEIVLRRGGAEVSGAVNDVWGAPIGAALIELSTRRATVPTLILSDEDGRFRAHVPAGLVELVARSDGFAAVARQAFAPERGIQLALSPASEIAGQVVDENEQPIAGMTVKARSRVDAIPLPIAVTSNGEGEFHIGGLTGGRFYEVSAEGDTWRSDSRSVFVGVGQTNEQVMLRAKAATSLSGVVRGSREPCVDAPVIASGPISRAGRTNRSGEIHLNGLVPGSYQVAIYCPASVPFTEWIELGQTPSHREWTVQPGLEIRGKVLNPHGEPVDGALVVVNAAGSMRNGGTTCVSSQSGEFRCLGLMAGHYECAVNDKGDPTREVVAVQLEEGLTPSVVLRTRPEGTISVALAPLLPDLEHIRIFARGPSGFPISTELRGNRFVLEGAPLGHYEVYAELPSASRVAQVDLTEHGQVVSVELEPPVRGVIAGWVVDERGAPIIDAWVRASPSDQLARPYSGLEPPTLTDERGAFVLPGLARGRYHLSVESAGKIVEEHNVETGSTELVLSMDKAGSALGAASAVRITQGERIER